jgi:hypothetical protein
MNDTEFDRALIDAAFARIATGGWSGLSPAAVAREAGLDLARTRARMPDRSTLLCRFGSLADQAALTGLIADAPVREALFDMLMRRIDMLQAHRAGVLALMKAIPFDPPAAALLGATSLRSMAFMLSAAGVEGGLLMPLRAHGLLAVWLWTLRAWQRDETEDLAPTMAALDQALTRAETAESWLKGRRTSPIAPGVPAADPLPPG